MDYKNDHPERKEDEVFLGNFDPVGRLCSSWIQDKTMWNFYLHCRWRTLSLSEGIQGLSRIYQKIRSSLLTTGLYCVNIENISETETNSL